MEFLNKLCKKELKNMLEAVMDNLEEYDEEVYNKCYKLIEDYLYNIPLDTAKEIVTDMVPQGEVYSYEFVVDFLKKHNNYNEITEPKCSIEYYLVMNMIYNDYKPVLDKYGMANNNLFCYDLSKCFIEDKDGGEHKVSRYFLMLDE